MAVRSFHVIMIGDPEVGRADVFLRYVEGDKYQPGTGLAIGEDSKTNMIELNGNKVKMHISDPAGKKKNNTLFFFLVILRVLKYLKFKYSNLIFLKIVVNLKVRKSLDQLLLVFINQLVE